MSLWSKKNKVIAPVEFLVSKGQEIMPNEVKNITVKVLKVKDIDNDIFKGSKVIFGAGSRVFAEGVILELYNSSVPPQ